MRLLGVVEVGLVEADEVALPQQVRQERRAAEGGAADQEHQRRRQPIVSKKSR